MCTACVRRRGAAHGLAGAIKGLNIRALNEYGVLDALKKGLDDKVYCPTPPH